MVNFVSEGTLKCHANSLMDKNIGLTLMYIETLLFFFFLTFYFFFLTFFMVVGKSICLSFFAIIIHIILVVQKFVAFWRYSLPIICRFIVQNLVPILSSSKTTMDSAKPKQVIHITMHLYVLDFFLTIDNLRWMG